MPYINPDLVKNLTPTLAQLKKYVQLANATDSSHDIRLLMSWLARLPQVDQHFLGLIETRKLALLGFDYRIDMMEGLTPKEPDKKRIAEMTARFRKSNMPSVFNAIMNGRLFGMGAIRLLWQNTSSYKSIVTQKTIIDLTELDYDKENAGDLVMLETNQATGQYTISKLDPKAHIIVRYNPLDGIDNNFIGSVAPTNMIYFRLKYDDTFHWAKANDKFGDPTIWLEYMEGTDPKDVAKLEKSLEQLSQASRAAFPSNIKMHMLEAARSSIADMHQKFIEVIKTEMSISVLGQTLTTEIGNIGSKAAAQVHNFVRQDILWGDIIFFQNILTDQYIARDFGNNYGSTEECPYVFRFNTDEIGDAEVNSRVAQNLIDMGADIREDELYRRTGFTAPIAGDATIKSQATRLSTQPTPPSS